MPATGKDPGLFMGEICNYTVGVSRINSYEAKTFELNNLVNFFTHCSFAFTFYVSVWSFH